MADTVTQLNTRVKEWIESNTAFSNVCVTGEISNYKFYPSSGHHYFTLKDPEGCLSCVMFKFNSFSLKFRPENGMQVEAEGNVTVYVKDGRYQLNVKKMSPAGAGDLQQAFELLKTKLEAEGLFAESHKKKLPVFPNTIAVVTSDKGAAVHDVIRILGQRWPLAKVVVLPVKVQGDGASEDIIKAIRFANDKSLADLLIVGRGGGSAEDLWAFNDEMLARTIYASEIPVISAVGHEPDVTISDYVADRRAATPSNAAEIAVPDWREIRALLNGYKVRLNSEDYFNSKRMDMDRWRDRLEMLEKSVIAAKKQQFLKVSAALDAMSPIKVLSRGYAVVTKDGNTVTKASVLNEGDEINVKFSEGCSTCKVLKSQLED